MIPPLENLKFWTGAGLVALVLSSSHLLDGPSEIEAAQATEASRQDALNDALAAAQAERPELWTPELETMQTRNSTGQQPSGRVTQCAN